MKPRQTTNKLAYRQNHSSTCQKQTTPTPKDAERRQNKSQRHKLHDTLLSSQTSHASGADLAVSPRTGVTHAHRTPMKFGLAVGAPVVTDSGERGGRLGAGSPIQSDLVPRRSLATRRTLQTRPADTNRGGGQRDPHACEPLLPPPEDQPGAGDQVAARGHVVDVLDPHVVEVDAALGDGPPGLPLAGRQTGQGEQVDDAGDAVRGVDVDRAGLAQRGGEGRARQRRDVTAAEQRLGGRLGLRGLRRRRGRAWSPRRRAPSAPRAGTASRHAAPRAPRSPRGGGR